jgi:hypothetical protein
MDRMATSRRAGGGSRQHLEFRTAVSVARHPRRFAAPGSNQPKSGPSSVAETMRCAFMPMVTIKGEEIDLRPMTREQAAIYRQICTELNLHEYCPFRACRRARRCATRQVLCHQALRQEINAIVEPLLRERLAKGPEAYDAAAVTPVTDGVWPGKPAAARLRPPNGPRRPS